MAADSRVSSTTSVTDSIFSPIGENGRLYHSFQDGKYVLPNDNQEQERLDFQKYLLNLTLEGNLFPTPVNPKTLRNMLDIGTGAGIWAIELADQFPEAKITGTDLSAVSR